MKAVNGINRNDQLASFLEIVSYRKYRLTSSKQSDIPIPRPSIKHMQPHTHSSRTMTHNRNLFLISPKSPNMFSNPLQSENLIFEPYVQIEVGGCSSWDVWCERLGTGWWRGGGKAEGTESITIQEGNGFSEERENGRGKNLLDRDKDERFVEFSDG